MKICITVKANAKAEKVEKNPAGGYVVCVKAPPIEGRANKAVIEALSDYFDVPKSRITISTGLKSKRKIIAIQGI